MKKITRSVFALSIILSSCTKEPNYLRNYSQPLNGDDVTGVQRGGNITWYEGISDEELINQIKKFDTYDPSKPIFLSPYVYDSNNGEKKGLNSPNPDYMLFPHSISTTSNTFNNDYLKEFYQLRNERGAEGTQIFLDIYLQGDSTLGMKLNKNF